MARNPRQRRRYQLQKKQEKQNKILLASLLLITGILLISISFNISGINKNNPQKQALEETQEAQKIAEETNQEPQEQQQEPVDEELQKLIDNPIEKNKEAENEDTTITITALGDIICQNAINTDALNKTTNEYDYSHIFENVSYYTKIADLAIGNLDTNFAGEEKSYKTYNAPDKLAHNLKSIGIDVLTTASNHSLDYGYEGLSRTIDTLNEADISHTGTYKTQEEKNTTLIKYAKGIKIAIVNYTNATNGKKVPEDKKYCINKIDKTQIQAEIEKAKNQEPDIIIACMNWGKENEASANNEQKEIADILFQNGVDIIIGNHPHILQSMEKRTVTLEDGTQKDGFVVYSLGNFISDQNKQSTLNSAILNLKVTKHKDAKITIDSADYVPIYMNKDTTAKENKFKLLDIERSIETYNAGDLTLGSKKYTILQQQLENVKKALGAEF